MAYPPLGAQLIVFSRQVNLDERIEDVLDAVAQAGFGAIECGVTTGAEDPRRFRALLDSKGLRVAGMHGALAQDVDQTLRLAEAYDARDVCISGLGGYGKRVAARFREDLDAFNELARTLSRHSVRLHYHNHAYEFEATDEGPSGMDIIREGLDPDLGSLCVDVAWVQIGGSDPALFLRENAQRIGYVHLKDYDGERHWVELGSGIVPLDKVMAELASLPRVRWAVYEQDTSDRPAAEACALSHRFLVERFGYA